MRLSRLRFLSANAVFIEAGHDALKITNAGRLMKPKRRNPDHVIEFSFPPGFDRQALAACNRRPRDRSVVADIA